MNKDNEADELRKKWEKVEGYELNLDKEIDVSIDFEFKGLNINIVFVTTQQKMKNDINSVVATLKKDFNAKPMRKE
jgi:2C-methyl-D-erythritol 2,4-cyclodiphosphate synthase